MCEFYIMPHRRGARYDKRGWGRNGPFWGRRSVQAVPNPFPRCDSSRHPNTPRLRSPFAHPHIPTSPRDARPHHGDVWSHTPTTPYPSRRQVRPNVNSSCPEEPTSSLNKKERGTAAPRSFLPAWAWLLIPVAALEPV